MTACVIFGGSGYIGGHLAKHLLATGRFSAIHLADIVPPAQAPPTATSSITDVRKEVPRALSLERPDWIFNLAAVHREPGHSAHEYFETNLSGARNVCAYADAVGCSNIFFTSSISVYGPTDGPTSEASPIRPVSPYGGSKYPAELIHETWLAAQTDRRLVVCRPGVVYGPGDPGNILRMIRAIKRGYFAYPGSPAIRKSYAYIYGLLESIDFVTEQDFRHIVYNYVETPTEPLGELVRQTKQFVGSSAPVLRIPSALLAPTASIAQALLGSGNPIHPVRVRKAGMSTHVVPQVLTDMGFEFRFPYLKSLEHWRSIAPSDFSD